MLLVHEFLVTKRAHALPLFIALFAFVPRQRFISFFIYISSRERYKCIYRGSHKTLIEHWLALMLAELVTLYLHLLNDCMYIDEFAIVYVYLGHFCIWSFCCKEYIWIVSLVHTRSVCVLLEMTATCISFRMRCKWRNRKKVGIAWNCCNLKK